jgi:RNase P/RNase MRP subunit POP5
MLREKRRYIGFVIESERELSRNEVIYFLNQIACQPRLILLEGKKGIVKVPIKDVQSVRQNLNKIIDLNHEKAKFSTVITSGTIITVKQKLGLKHIKKRKKKEKSNTKER